MCKKTVDITEARKAEIKTAKILTEALAFGSYDLIKNSRKNIVVSNKNGEGFELSFRVYSVSEYLKMRAKLLKHSKNEP